MLSTGCVGRSPHAVLVVALVATTGCYSYAPAGRYPSAPGYYSSPPPGVYSQPGVFSAPAYGQPGGIPPGAIMGPGTTVPPGSAAPPDGFMTPGSGFTPNSSSPPGGNLPPGGNYPGDSYPGGSSPTYGSPNNGPINGGPRDANPPRSRAPFEGERAPFESNSPPRTDRRAVPPARSLDTPNTAPFESGSVPFGAQPNDNRFTQPRSGRGTNPPPAAGGNGGTFGSGEQPFGENGGAAILPMPATEGPATASAARALTPVDEGPKLQSPPEPVIPAGAEFAAPIIKAEASRKPQRHPNPHDFDRNAYRWIRGTVDYDEEDKSWYLIYNLTPDENDVHQGGLTLVGDPVVLGALHDGDVVQVEGEVQKAAEGFRHSTVFHVEKLEGLATAGM
ncbi:MAG: hypothetical protein IT428_14845 [Planctomycetaceae bacterium]|nr:hypothetical protein [Planctomycetaceae bacterium]